MEVFLNDNLIDDAFVDGATTVEDALRHVQENHCKLDQMVISLRCNGQAVADDAMARTLERPATSFDRLEVVTGSRCELVIDAMAQASNCLSETDAPREQIADLLQEGNTAKAVETLGECLQVWQQIHEAIGKSIEMLRIDAEQKMVGDQPLIEYLLKPKEVLLQVRDALKIQDYVLLADTLQYEFSQVTDNWHTLIATLRQEAENHDTGDAVTDEQPERT